ncbi:hypothetical protein I6E36_09110, partial [Fusobacterium mortiferum]|uniref:hypothetical protein n=1 Tax=Fusobacterium mortiferum TaxID=850 RepID=UPI001F2BCC1C
KSLKRKLKLLLLLFIKKIQDFSDNKVTFYYEDLSNNKEKVEVTMEVEEFHILIYQKAPFVGKNIVGCAD